MDIREYTATVIILYMNIQLVYVAELLFIMHQELVVENSANETMYFSKEHFRKSLPVFMFYIKGFLFLFNEKFILERLRMVR